MIMIVIWFEIFFLLSDAARDTSFGENYYKLWGNDHIVIYDQGREVQLTLDQTSGSGFASKAYYGSGFFQMRIKLPEFDSGGVVTAFYLNNGGVTHDELDFEFLGNRPGKRITLQTNVYVNGIGGREQRIRLWFDPTADFHYYKLLWNEHQIVFFVDNTPIRVHKNMNGVAFPDKPMQLIVSLWDGSAWATDGGKTKVDYRNAPFQAYFQDFRIDGCVPGPNKDCYSPRYIWNSYRQLNRYQQSAYDNVKLKYVTYDYCNDWKRYPMLPPECHE